MEFMQQERVKLVPRATEDNVLQLMLSTHSLYNDVFLKKSFEGLYSYKFLFPIKDSEEISYLNC